MKASRYNRLFQTSDGTWLAFNSWSTALAEIEPENLDFLRALLAAPDETPCDDEEKRAIREALVDAHFLVPDEEDELTTLKADLLKDRFSTERLDLTIAPTMNCNFRCDYCFEEHLKVTMSKPVAEKLVSWTDERLRGASALAVTWYGGEPLLPSAYPVVERLSEAFLGICEKRELRYDAHLVTNGFYLDREKMKSLAALGVSKVQLTLDGPPEIHDRRRHLLGGKGTFWRIVENLENTVDLAEFQLRINVDRRNAMSALEVIEILAERGLAGKVRPYLAQVTFDGAACGNILEACYSNDDFAKTELDIYREAAARGLPLTRYPFRVEGAFCIADRINGFVVAPNGSLFKCWHEVTMSPDNAIGSLLDGQQPFQKVNEDRFLRWDAFEKTGCRSCDVAPLCHGGCPIEAMQHPEKDTGACEHFKFHLEPLLEIRHQMGSVEGEGAGPAARHVGVRAMRRVGLIGPPEREELVRLAIRLEERGAEPVVFDSRLEPAIEMDADAACLQGVDLKEFSGFYVSDLGIRSPWVRDESGGFDAEATRRALAASRRHLAAWNTLLMRMSSRARVANPPHTHDLHGLKPWEMSVYERLDIPVPWTLSTSSAEKLQQLVAESPAPALVRKGLVGGYGFTEALEPEEIAGSLSAGGALQVQERVEGDNLRVFVLGGQVLGGATIYSKDGGATDNRRGDIRVERLAVPADTAAVAARAASHWGLAFTAVDFMRDARTGRDLMLECNSSPFFVGFERATGIDVGSALADYLLARGAYRD